MSDIIQLLPDSVANQIAAGEVIQRPASVVKELMENAVDAGATSVQVVLKDAGRTLIQVIDNGKGMSETDARLSFERHATSKIRKADDLFSLHTMGFRGEALASIAAIAQVELRTRREEDEVGVKLCISGSEVESQEPVSAPVGSNFQVKNLFYNVPARRKFLKGNDTELSNIMTEFERVALVNTNVSFTIYHNDVERVNLPLSGLRQRIVNTLGKALNKQLLSVDVDTSLISMSGYVGRPESARKKKALQYFFVNGRYMRHPYFHKAVMQSYENIIAAGENPNYFLYLKVDPANIDVNIHPTKTEIKFENESYIWQIISAAVKEALGKFSAIPSIDFDTEDAPEIPIHNQKTVTTPSPSFDSSYNPFSQQPAKPQYSNWQSLYEGFKKEGGSAQAQSFRSRITSDDDFEQNKDFFPTDDTLAQTPSDQVDLIPSAMTDLETETSDESNIYRSRAFDEDADDDSIASALPTSRAEALTDEQIPQMIHSSADMFASSDTKSALGNLQFKGRYILNSVKSGLMMIDQHRAHVRVLYDQYIGRINSRKGVSQGVLFPEILSFTPSEVPVLESILEDLHFLGFDLSSMGGCSFAINGTPAGIEGLNVESLLHSMIDTASSKARDVKSDIQEMMALSLAEAAAIPYGEVLNNEEMDKLIDDLFTSSSPNYTPDGKLILSVFGTEEINKRFK